MTMQEIRYSRLYEKMEEKGLDAVYVRSAENHLYMSHFDNPDGYLFLTRKEGWVFADFRYTEAAKEASFPGLHVCEPGKPKLEELMVSENCKRVGYEDNALTCAALANLQQRMPEVEWVPVGNMFSLIRAAKTQEEVDSIVAAQRIAAENSNVNAHVYDIRHFENLKNQYNVMSVPCLVINDEQVYFGKKNLLQILELL